MLRRGEVGCRALNDHGNYIIDHGKIMEKSWNFVFEFLWEPCIGHLAVFNPKFNLIYYLPSYIDHVDLDLHFGQASARIDAYPATFCHQFLQKGQAQTLNPHTADCTMGWDCGFSDSSHL